MLSCTSFYRRYIPCCFWVGIWLFLCYGVSAQTHPTTIAKESLLILPPDYQEDTQYPVLVLMPYTSGSAHDYFNKYLSEAKIMYKGLSYKEQLRQFLELYNQQYQTDVSFAVLIPDGIGSRNDHSWEGFSACIERYEKRVLRDVRKFSRLYNLDTTQVYISGVSLGGDLSWALTVRNPHFFKGAIVVGSRCSFPPNGSLPILSQRGFRYFMVMGMNEGQDRLVGMRYARQLLDSAYVQYDYREMPFMEHERAPLWLFLEGLHWLLQPPPAPLFPAPLAVEWQNGTYTGYIEQRTFRLEQEDGLSARGDGLLLPQQITRLDHQPIVIEQKEGFLWVQAPNLPPLRARFLPDPAQPSLFHIELLEQEAQNRKYQGLSADPDYPKRHGFWDQEAQMWALDFESFPLTNHNLRTAFSLSIVPH